MRLKLAAIKTIKLALANDAASYRRASEEEEDAEDAAQLAAGAAREEEALLEIMETGRLPEQLDAVREALANDADSFIYLAQLSPSDKACRELNELADAALAVLEELKL